MWKIVIDFLYNICKEREEKPKVKEKVNFERERKRERRWFDVKAKRGEKIDKF